MRRGYGNTTQKILDLLAQNGPMTRAEITKELGYERDYVSAVVGRLARKLVNTPKRIHIVGYTYDMEGERRYPRAIFALGDGEDLKRPKAQTKANKKRYREKLKGRFYMNSVFNLGRQGIRTFSLGGGQCNAQNAGT